MQDSLDILSIDDLDDIEIKSLDYCFRNNFVLDFKDILFRTYIHEKDYLNINIVRTQHGIRHHLRVQIYALIIMKLLFDDRVDTDMINYICSIHDTQRQNDFKDINHGLLAYNKFVKDNDNFSDKDKKIIRDTLENHDSKIEYTDNIYLMILKCADALDRFRLKNEKGFINYDKIPNSKLDLCIRVREISKMLIMFTRYFTLKTEKYHLEHLDVSDYDNIINNWESLWKNC